MHLTKQNYQSILFCGFVILCVISYCSSAPQGYHYSYPNRRTDYSYNQPQRTRYNNNSQRYYYGKPNGIAATPATVAAAAIPAQPGKYRVSKADAENAKFAGTHNLEDSEESGKSLKHFKRKVLRRYLNPCSAFGRDAGASSRNQEQGRFLFDLNVYNVYPGANVGGIGGGPCRGYGGGLGGFGGYGGGLGGGGLGGGLLSDPVAGPAYAATTPLTNFLGLFAPGVLQNVYGPQGNPAAAYRPQQLADEIQDLQNNQANRPQQADDLQSDPAVDPAYVMQQPVRRPNRVYYDSAGAPPASPAQLVGGFATTINGIIQQLTGNVQPVYGQTYRRTRRYY